MNIDDVYHFHLNCGEQLIENEMWTHFYSNQHISFLITIQLLLLKLLNTEYLRTNTSQNSQNTLKYIRHTFKISKFKSVNTKQYYLKLKLKPIIWWPIVFRFQDATNYQVPLTLKSLFRVCI